MNNEIIVPPDAVISHGQHSSYGAGTCALELVDYMDRSRRGVAVASTDILTDAPACVCPTVRTFVVSWNDSLPTDTDRQRLLGPLLPLMLDTAAGTDAQVARSWMALDWLVRVHAVAWLYLAGLTEHAQALRTMPAIDSTESATAGQAAIDAARDAAGDAARAAAWDAAWDAAGDAARAAAEDAEREWQTDRLMQYLRGEV